MIRHFSQYLRILYFIMVCLSPIIVHSPGMASVGEDMEKPVPEFTRSEKTITAKLIPRAKSNNVLIEFGSSQGQLTDVKGIEFETLQTSDLDIKEFKSSFFEITVDLPAGTETDIVISSPFFTVSTEYWIYNSNKSIKWTNSGIKANKGDDNIAQFTIRVKDGGELDADGIANGRVQLIGGPKDYFWSYALGTLVVRFFGVFLVLSVLMVGMQIVGLLFVSLEKRRNRPAASPSIETVSPQTAIPTEATASPEPSSKLDLDTVAAIAAALHLHLTAKTQHGSHDTQKAASNAWVQYGRVEIQITRAQTFSRPIKPNNHF